MGCGDTKEKIEDEMIKIKFKRAEIQMERKKQLKLLEEIEGKKISEPVIPDYISFNQEKHENKNQTEIKANSVCERKPKSKKAKKKSPEKKSKNKSVKEKIRNKKTESTKPESKKKGN